MRSNDIDSTQNPSGPVVRLGADHHHLREDREVFYCIGPLAEIIAGQGATIEIPPALLSPKCLTSGDEVPHV